MIIKSSLFCLLASTALLAVAPVLIAAEPTAGNAPAAQKEASASVGKLVPVTEKNAASFAKERENYPVTTCVISGDKLGSMGDSPEYVYQVAGKPDRFVIFCCDGCEEDFLKEPAKHLATLDAAAKAKGMSSKKADAPKNSGGGY